jgi:succinate dehydrogenase/fumarate reductase cytochrome b subunit
VRPNLKSTLALLVAGAILFVLSASGQTHSYWKSGPSWLGAVGWFGFLICLLLLIVSGVYVLVSRMRGHDRSATQ